MNIPIRQQAEKLIGSADHRTGRDIEHEIKMSYMAGVQEGMKLMKEAVA